MVNKFDEKNLRFVNLFYGRDMLKISKIYEIARCMEK